MYDSTSSIDIRVFIASLLSTRGVLTSCEIKDSIEKRWRLRRADFERVRGRPCEKKIRNTVGNALRECAFLCANDYIIRIGRDLFRITPRGREWLNRIEAILQSADARAFN